MSSLLLTFTDNFLQLLAKALCQLETACIFSCFLRKSCRSQIRHRLNGSLVILQAPGFKDKSKAWGLQQTTAMS